MLIQMSDVLRFLGKPLSGVIHVGAFIGEEIPSYFGHNATSVIAFEPLTEQFNKIGQHDRLIRIKKAVGAFNGKAEMHIASNLQSSSILAPKDHLVVHPEVTFNGRTETVDVTTLNDWFKENALDPSDYCFLNVDVQGYESEVFRGASEILPHLSVVLAEVNSREHYEGTVLISGIDSMLAEYGYKRVMVNWWSNCGWGDALYVRNTTT